jgi:hypothetical protein
MRKRDSKPETQPHALRLRRDRLQALMFHDATSGAGLALPSPKIPPLQGE